MYILFASEPFQDTERSISSFMPSAQQCSPTFVDFLQSREVSRYFWKPFFIIGLRVAPVIATYYFIRRKAYLCPFTRPFTPLPLNRAE